MQKQIIEVTIDGAIKEIEIKEIPIIKYPEILKSLKELPKHLKDFDKKETEDIIEEIPYLIGVAAPDIINILAIILEGQLTRKQVEELGATPFLKMVMALFEVNNFQETYKILKKALAQLPQTTPMEKTVVAALKPKTS